MGGDGRVRTDEGRHQTAGHRTDGHRTAGHRTAGHRTAGHRTAGHRTGGQQPSDRRTLWTTTPGDRTPDGWTAGSRTPRPDGWTPPAGHRRPTPWRACWPGRPWRRRLSARSRLDAPPGRRRPGEQPPGPLSSKDAGGTPRWDGWVWPPPRQSAASGTPLSSWRLGALLSSDDFGSSVERRGGCHPVYGDGWRGLQALIGTAVPGWVTSTVTRRALVELVSLLPELLVVILAGARRKNESSATCRWDAGFSGVL
jgi:hypothetical protein